MLSESAIPYPLDGSTITSAIFSRGGLNNLGQVAFEFSLADGRQGIAVYTPSTGDLDGDGDFDGKDFLDWQGADSTALSLGAWQANYSTTGVESIGAVADLVPEASTQALILSTCFAASWLRPNKRCQMRLPQG